jgi:hypothetical protein
VKRKNLAELLGRAVMREQGIIRRMIGGIAEPGDAVHRNEDPVRIEQPDDREGGGA